jgi:hypothetical protein
MSEALKEISLILDVWDDIFSDFDPRPLDERELSEDFVNELKKRYRETPEGALLLSFYAPKSLKDNQSEQMVIRRLRKYFKDKSLQKKRAIHNLKTRGILFALIGILSLCSITLISYFTIFSPLVIQLLEILFVPLGWFGIWEGFSKLINTSPMLAHEKELYHKLSTAEYQFHYEA